MRAGAFHFPTDAARAKISERRKLWSPELQEVSTGHSTRIAEVKDVGRATEHEAPVGHDHGFLWRLNTFSRMEEKDGGVYLECRSITLSRSVATGLGWLIYPIIRTFPRESLAHLLTESRNGILDHSR